MMNSGEVRKVFIDSPHGSVGSSLWIPRPPPPPHGARSFFLGGFIASSLPLHISTPTTTAVNVVSEWFKRVIHVSKGGGGVVEVS